MSFESFIVQVGALVGSLTFGYITQVSSIRETWLVAGGVLLVSSLTYLILASKKYSSKIRVETCSAEMVNAAREELV